MRRGILGLTAVLALVYAGLGARGERRAVAQTATQAQAAVNPQTVAIVTTARDALARESEVRFVHLDAGGARATTVARLPHGPGAVVRGDVLRNARAVVVVADAEGPPSDWGSSLHRVDESGKIVLLATGLYHASRPLASVDGAVYVERGAVGTWPSSDEAARGRLRTDPLHVDAIDPVTGVARTLYAWSGYTLHIAGELGGELLVYRVAFEGADLVAIDRASGRSRIVTTLLPFARDFSVDEKRGALVMSNRDAQDTHLWVLERVDVASGARTHLASARDETPMRPSADTERTKLTNDDVHVERLGLVGAAGSEPR